MSKRHPSALVSFLYDLGVVAALAAVIWFFLGHFLQASYFETGYHDFIAHAFRIEEIERNGIASWTFAWGNGINLWRNYQYVPHLLTLGVKYLTHTTTVKAMLITLVSLAYLYALTTYVFLRKLHITRLTAATCVLLFFSTINFWNNLRDYSVVFSFAILPAAIYIFIQDLKHSRHSLSLAILSGLTWYIHPILGYSITYLWLWTFSLELSAKNIRVFLSKFVVFILCMLPFVIPYLTKGYSYSNPLFSSSLFAKQNTSEEYYGLGFFVQIAFVASWVLMMAKSMTLPKWSKILLVSSTLYLFFIFLARKGVLPSFVLGLQIGRATPFIAIQIIFVFAALVNDLTHTRSRFLRMIPTIFLALLCIGIVTITSQKSWGLLTEKSITPIEELMKMKEIHGLVHLENESEASFFSKGKVPMIGTYMEHLEPMPLSQRFKSMTWGGMSYTGVSKKQTDLIADYATLYGIEYIIIPKFSPIVANLTASGSATPAFTIADIPSSDAQLAFLQSTRVPASAYAVLNANLISFDEFEKPNLNVVSWKPWDDEVTHLADAIREGTLLPIPLKKIGTEEFQVDLNSLPATSSGILVTISHDQNWKATGIREGSILPTALKMMYIDHSDLPESGSLQFTHHWPSWHWPLQIGVGVIGLLVIVGDQLYWYLAGLHAASLQRKEEQHVPKKI